MKAALKTAVDKGDLVQVKASYRLSPDARAAMKKTKPAAKKAAPKKKATTTTPKKTTAKKPSAKKTTVRSSLYIDDIMIRSVCTCPDFYSLFCFVRRRRRLLRKRQSKRRLPRRKRHQRKRKQRYVWEQSPRQKSRWVPAFIRIRIPLLCALITPLLCSLDQESHKGTGEDKGSLQETNQGRWNGREAQRVDLVERYGECCLYRGFKWLCIGCRPPKRM
jgi:hypothetical protein